MNKFKTFLSNWLVGLTTILALVGAIYLIKLISLIPYSGEIVTFLLVFLGLPYLLYKAFEPREKE